MFALRHIPTGRLLEEERVSGFCGLKTLSRFHTQHASSCTISTQVSKYWGGESFCRESKSSPLTSVESEPMSRWFNFEKRSEGDLTLKYDRHNRFLWRCMGTLFECLPFWILVNLYNICSDKISGTFSLQFYTIFHISFSFEIAFYLQAVSSSSCSSYLRIANLLIGSQLLGSRCGALKLPTRKIALFQHRRQPTGWARVREKTRK